MVPLGKDCLCASSLLMLLPWSPCCGIIVLLQDNDIVRFFTSPNKNWAFSSSGSFLKGNANSSDYTKNMTCGAHLSPVSLNYYAFCLREGKYNVTLKFAEIVYTKDTDYTSLRKRAFNIYIQANEKHERGNLKEMIDTTLGI